MSEFIDWGNVTKPCNDGESGGRLWTLDPIDGTLGYLRDEQYSICLAKFNKEKTDIELSFLYCPNLSQILPDLQSTSGNHGIPLYFSQKGLGAYLVH